MKKLFIFLSALTLTSCSLANKDQIVYEYPPYKTLWFKVEPPKEEAIKPVAKPTPKPTKPKKKLLPKKPVAAIPPKPPTPTATGELTVDQAYEFSGTARRSFADYPNTIAADENLYLKQLFRITDTFVIGRNQLLKTSSFNLSALSAALTHIEQLDPPKLTKIISQYDSPSFPRSAQLL